MPEIIHGGVLWSSSTSKAGKSRYDLYRVGATLNPTKKKVDYNLKSNHFYQDYLELFLKKKCFALHQPAAFN
jgi:hypothetical protein